MKARLNLIKNKMTNKTSQEQIEKQIAHLDGYRDSQLIRDALLGKRTLEKACCDFYDLEGSVLHYHAGPVRVYSDKHEFDSKTKQFPGEVFEIADNFGEEPLNEKLLSYDDVRESYKKNVSA